MSRLFHRGRIPLRDQRRTRASKNQRGAVLVESAIVVIVVAIIINGILDYGTLFGDDNDLVGATRAAALAGSATAITPIGDSAILQAVIDKKGGSRANIKRIVVYQASGTNQLPPANCINNKPGYVGEAADACNIYTSATTSYFSSATINSNAILTSLPGGKSWPSSVRNPGVDYIGVWVLATRVPLMTIVWSPAKYSDHFVVRMEAAVVTPPGATATGFANGTSTDPGPTQDSWFCLNGQLKPKAASTCKQSFQGGKGSGASKGSGGT